MGVLAWIGLGMGVDTRGVDTGLKKARGKLDEFRAAAEKTSRPFDRPAFFDPRQWQGAADLVRPLAALGLSAAGISVAFRGVANVVGDSVKLGSDLNEELSKTDVIFGSMSGRIKRFANENASTFGTVRTETLDATNRFAALGAGIGKLAGRDLAAFSERMALLAQDLASQDNLDFGEAVRRLSSGLSGEAEPLKAHGVLVDEAAVKARAWALGLAEVGRELDGEAKFLARVAVIQESLARVQGDRARTAGGRANLDREVAGRIANLKADFGSAVQSISTSLLSGAARAISGLSAGFADSKDTIQRWAEASVRAGGLVHTTIVGIGSGLAALVDAVASAAAKVALLWRGFVAGGALVAGAWSWIDAGSAQSTLDSLASMARGLDSVVAAGDGRAGDAVRAFFKDFADGADAAAGAVQDLAGPMVEIDAAALRLSASIDGTVSKFREQLDTMGASSAETELYRLAAAGATEAQLAEARSLGRTLDLVSTARKVIDDTRTPAEELAAKTAELDRLSAAGLIDDETRRRALAKTGAVGGDHNFAGAVELGSTEARTAVLRHRAGDGKDPLLSTAERQLVTQRETLRAIRQLRGVTGYRAEEVYAIP